MKDNSPYSSALLARLKSIKEKEKKKNNAERKVKRLREDIERLTEEKNKAIRSQLDAESEYLDAMNNLALDRPISAVAYAKELIRANNPQASKAINRDKSLKIMYGYTIAPITTDFKMSDELFKAVTMPDGNMRFKNNSEQDKKDRLNLVKKFLNDNINIGKWDGKTNAFFFISGDSGYTNVFANIDFSSNLKDGGNLFDHIVSATYDFMPTIEFGKAMMKVEVSLRFGEMDDVMLNLSAESFCCIGENEQCVLLDDEATHAYCRALEKSIEE